MKKNIIVNWNNWNFEDYDSFINNDSKNNILNITSLHRTTLPFFLDDFKVSISKNEIFKGFLLEDL